MAGMAAFREAYLHADAQDAGEFGSPAARQLRYEILWAFFENTAYRKIHTWAQKFKADFGLYKHTRNVYNPAARLGNFWQTYLMGGALDPLAGPAGALPIITENDALRPAIANLWRDSNWMVNKDVFTLRGAVLGDAALRVVDDPERGKVYLQLVNPGALADVTLDAFGNVKGYTLEEARADPRNAERSVIYRETAERADADVVYATFLDGAPYAWNGQAAEWTEPYGFVPLVLCQHNNVGLSWGWSELHPALSKIREVDDVASKVSDHVRKYVDPAWLFTGMGKPKKDVALNQTTPTAARPEPMRDEIPSLYIENPDAKATALVAPLDLAATLQHVQEMIGELERDYPELKFEVLRLGGQVSGAALRTAQEPVEQKVRMRRAGYDDALRRAQQMAVAIGGWRGYAGYAGFGLESYAAGALDHAIGDRPVFADSSDDRQARELAFWQAARAATESGMPLGVWLEKQGWTPEDVARVVQSAEYQAKQAPQFG